MAYVMVLDDGETFSPLDDCVILEVPVEADSFVGTEAVEELIAETLPKDLPIVATFGENKGRAVMQIREGEKVEVAGP